MVVVAHGVRGQPLRAARGAPLNVYISLCVWTHEVYMFAMYMRVMRERECVRVKMCCLAGKDQYTARPEGSTLERFSTFYHP